MQVSTRGGAAVARQAHNLKVGGSNPPPATKYPPEGGEGRRRRDCHERSPPLLPLGRDLYHSPPCSMKAPPRRREGPSTFAPAR